MLNPYENRCNYSDELKPPFSYSLDFAIGTTYSLNFDALIGSFLSLCFGQDVTDYNVDDTVNANESISSILNLNPAYLLAVLDKIKDNIAIYCEAGKIYKPETELRYCIKLEDSIYQIKKKDGIFHPKMWLIRYKNIKGNYKYRLIVLSRNITFDDNWDVICSFDGVETNNIVKNDTLIEFLNYLKKNTSDEKKKQKINSIKKGLKHIKFVNNNNEEIEFIPRGINSNEEDIFNIIYSNKVDTKIKSLIMSPFLSDDVVKKINNSLSSNANYLFTRIDAINEIKENSYCNFDARVLNSDLVYKNEKTELNDNDIHAKIFFVEKGDEKLLYLGSLNATYNGFYKNIELLVKIKCDDMSVRKLANLIISPKKDEIELFTQFNMNETKIIESKNDTLDSVINKVIKKISVSYISANVKRISNKYALEVNFHDFDKFKLNLDVEVSPYLKKDFKRIKKKIIFENLELLDLSMFYVFKVKVDNEKKVKEFVLKIDTSDIPMQREKEFVNSVIKKDNVYEYLEFMLGDIGASFALSMIKNNGDYKSEKVNYLGQGIYEKLLKDTYYNKETIKKINETIRELDNSVLDKELKMLIKTFSEALK